MTVDVVHIILTIMSLSAVIMIYASSSSIHPSSWSSSIHPSSWSSSIYPPIIIIIIIIYSSSSILHHYHHHDCSIPLTDYRPNVGEVPKKTLWYIMPTFRYLRCYFLYMADMRLFFCYNRYRDGMTYGHNTSLNIFFYGMERWMEGWMEGWMDGWIDG